MRIYPAYCILLFLLMVVSYPSALDSDSTFDHLGRSQGLSNSSVSAMAQDSEGFLWFATQGGLNRWDGYRMKVWRQEPFSTNSLSHNQVQSLFIDADGIIWLGTYGGLNRLDPRTGSLRVFTHTEGKPSSLSHNLVISILRDTQKRLWVGTLDGLNLLDEKTGEFQVFRTQLGNPRSLSSSTIRSIYEDASGRLWIGTEGGLDLWDDALKIFHRTATQFNLPILGSQVMSIVPDYSGGLYLGLWKGGIVHFQPDMVRAAVYPFPEVSIYSLSWGEDRQLYAGTWGSGLLVFDTDSGRSVFLRHDPKRSDSLSHDVVYGTYRDRSGVLWIYTNGGGLDRYNPRKKQFRSLTSGNSSLPPGKVTALYRDSSGRIWAGIYAGGLALLDSRQGVRRVFRSKPGDPSTLTSEVITCITEDNRGRLWVCTSEGLNLFREDSQTFQRFQYRKNGPSDLPDPVIYSAAGDGKDGLWVGTYREGLVHLKSLRPLEEPSYYKALADRPHCLPSNFVYTLFRDSLNRLWVGTNGGLALYRSETDDFQSWTHDPQNQSGLPSNAIRCLVEDQGGRVWVGSGGGLSLFDPKTGQFKNWGRAQGLTDLSVNGIEKDNAGNLWLTTDDGLFLFQPDKEIFRHYGTEDGLLSDEFTNGHCTGADGELLLGTLKGISLFNPGSFKGNSVAPRVVLTALQVVNQPHEITPVLNLSWWQNSFSAEFAALDYVSPGKNQYLYRLEGFDQDWVRSGTRNLAVYTNLNPGTYTLRVKGSNSDDVWSEMEVPLTVQVEAVPWLSWYAYLGYLAAFILFVYLIQKVKVSVSLKKKVQELEKVKLLLEEANRQLDQLSRMDSLTGIPNRRALDSWLEKEWALALREHKPVSVLMLDIDFFKRYNDYYGHMEGDVCLRTVASVIQKSLQRNTDFCARYGGEEFVVVLHDSDITGARLVAHRILESVDELTIPHKMSTAAPFVTVSIGLASRLPEPDVPYQELLHAADQNLYRAKSAGRHRIED